MALRQLCRSCGCPNYRIEGHNFCQKHLYMEQKNDKPDYNNFSESSPLYHCGRWRRERIQFLNKNPLCKCGAKATVIDHIIAHRGNEELFWDHNNWEALCPSCHQKKTWAEMRERRKK